MITEYTRRYWSYEYQVVARVLAPLLRRWGVELRGAAVLDVGCGEAGGLCALFDLGAKCSGFDVDGQRINASVELAARRTMTMVQGDVYAEPVPFSDRKFDLVVLHDVFEHLEQKEETLRRLSRYLGPGGRMMITFPPYYSAYGAHQQHLPFRFARLPFYHLLPGSLGQLLPPYAPEHEPAVSEAKKLSRLKMGMRSFERIAASAGMRIVHSRAYLLSPNYIRFGLKPLPAGPLSRIPGIAELVCTGVVYLLEPA
jgi:SAM-dependent methyltransferase